MTSSIRKIISTALMLLLCACANTSPEATALPLMTFAHLAPMPVNVGLVDVRDDTALISSSGAGGFVVEPSSAVESYLKRRFVAAGMGHSLLGVIEEAHVTSSHKPSHSKVGSFFDVAGTDEYEVVIRLRLEHRDNQTQPIYSNTMTARRVIRVSEHASVAERERKQLEGMESLFQDIDREAQRIVLEGMKIGL